MLNMDIHTLLATCKRIGVRSQITWASLARVTAARISSVSFLVVVVLLCLFAELLEVLQLVGLHVLCDKVGGAIRQCFLLRA